VRSTCSLPQLGLELLVDAHLRDFAEIDVAGMDVHHRRRSGERGDDGVEKAVGEGAGYGDGWEKITEGWASVSAEGSQESQPRRAALSPPKIAVGASPLSLINSRSHAIGSRR
jgi:hypothetical protein